MNNPKLAVLVAVYKAKQFIDAKLKNLQKQSIFEDLDIILLNCQNIDNERKIYKKYLCNNIREVLIEDYCTLYHSWNIGINTTKANCIINSNVDDMYHEKSCETYLNALQTHDVAFSYYAISKMPNRWNWNGSSPKNLIQRVAWDRLFLGPSVAVKKEIFKRSDLYDPDLYAAGDCDMWGRWNKIGVTTKVIKDPLVLYYHNHASLERRTEKGKSVIWIDGQTRKKKKAADWNPESKIPDYPKLKE